MPKVTVYIRNEDYEAWKNVVEKTKFMHDALNGEIGKGDAVNIKEDKDGTISPRRVGKTASFETKPGKDYGGQKLCKHGNLKGSCFEKTALRLKCNF